jgi:hypothetical protein
MGKMLKRLLGLGAFLVTFGCAAIVVFVLSTGLVDPAQFVPTGGGIQAPTPGEGQGGLPTPPEVEVPTIAPGETGTLADQVQPRTLLRDVPASPLDLSREPRVIGTNFFLAVLMALIFGATSTMLGNMLRDEEETIQGWLSKLGILKLFSKGAWWGARRAVAQGCLTLPLIVLIFALYGIIFAFLERGTSILSQEGAFLAVTLAFSVGLVSLSGDVAQRFVARLWREKSKFRIYPANLLIAAVTTATSRFLVLNPGIVFGAPGGVDVKLDESRRGRRVTLAFATLTSVTLLGGLGWAVSSGVRVAVSQAVDTRVHDLAVPLLTAAQNASLSVFLIAMETLFFEMLPLASGLGQVFYRWSKFAWVILFAPIAFLFNHALLNPQSGFLESFQVSNVRFMWLMLFALVGITATLWFYFNVLREMFGGPSKPPPPPPPPAYPPPAPPTQPHPPYYG